MIIQQISAIALRVFALWLLAQVALNLPTIILQTSAFANYTQQSIPFLFFISMISVISLIGLFAVFFINKAANSIITRATSTSETSLSESSQKLLFQLAGLYFSVDALAYLPRSLSFIADDLTVTLTNLLLPLGFVFQLVIGLCLIINPTYWSKLFERLRGNSKT